MLLKRQHQTHLKVKHDELQYGLTFIIGSLCANICAKGYCETGTKKGGKEDTEFTVKVPANA
jgi:hypothetical protein